MWNSKNVQIGVREMIQFVSSVSSQLIALFELFDKRWVEITQSSTLGTVAKQRIKENKER